MALLKKGQIEIIGLVIIVLLILFIVIFALSFYLSKQEPATLTFKALEIKANNLRNAVLKTTLCSGTTIKDEIESCYYGESICFTDCNIIKQKIKNLIDYSIEENYNFTVKNNEILFEITKESCEEKASAICEPIRDTGLEACVVLC